MPKRRASGEVRLQHIYPDCWPEFAAAMEDVLALCDWHNLSLDAPLCSTPFGIIEIFTGASHGRF